MRFSYILLSCIMSTVYILCINVSCCLKEMHLLLICIDWSSGAKNVTRHGIQWCSATTIITNIGENEQGGGKQECNSSLKFNFCRFFYWIWLRTTYYLRIYSVIETFSVVSAWWSFLRRLSNFRMFWHDMILQKIIACIDK